MKLEIRRRDVVAYDDLFRYHVPSRRKGVAPYLVQLDSFDGNGECQCEHFAMRLERFLRLGVPPDVAVESGLVEVPTWGTVDDALRCYHIHIAQLRLAEDITANRNKNEPTNTP